ncbi:MAG: hypothetical protein EXS31_11350 [Pedosphaera sp.]|nr:hypothetical protein [Pedosphaera sp.]
MKLRLQTRTLGSIVGSIPRVNLDANTPWTTRALVCSDRHPRRSVGGVVLSRNGQDVNAVLLFREGAEQGTRGACGPHFLMRGWNFPANTISCLALAIASLLVLSTLASAQVQGPSGNHYEIVSAQGISWNSAKTASGQRIFRGQSGHLVTITSAQEDAFVEVMRQEFVALSGLVSSSVQEFWIGGSQSPNSRAPGESWNWVNNEGSIPFENGGPLFSNWIHAPVLGSDQPDDCCGSIGTENNEENYLGIGIFGHAGWNDEGNNSLILGYVVEYDTTSPPTITLQPQSQTNTSGANVTFTVTATGTAPLTYQWRFNGANITGATSTTLTLAGIQKTQQGDYDVIVTNAGGSTTSQKATLTTSAPGDKLWELSVDGYIYSNPALGRDGTIYVEVYPRAPGKSKLLAVDQAGHIKWTADLPQSSTTSPVVSENDIIYVANGPNLLAFDSSGVQLKSSTFGIPQLNEPAIGLDGSLYIGPGENVNQFLAVDPAFTAKWRVTGNNFGSAPTAVDANGTVYFDNYRYLYALNPDGTPRWTLEQPVGNAFRSGPAISTKGDIYIAGDVGYVYSINRDGKLAWRSETQNIFVGYEFPDPVIGNDGSIYIGSTAGLYNFTSGGERKWVYARNLQFQSTPAIAADGTIYVGADDGPSGSGEEFLHAINPDGSIQWKFPTGMSGQFYSSPTIWTNGTVIVGGPVVLGQSNKLFAIRGSAPLAKSAWPKYRNDLGNTGRQPPSQVKPSPPSITAPKQLTMLEDVGSDAVPFVKSEADTPADQLIITVASLNPTLIPPSGITISGNGTNRSMKILPAANANGTGKIILSITDAQALMTSAEIDVTVNPVNDQPTLDPIGNLTLQANVPSQTVNLTGISTGPPNEVQKLTVTATSDKPALISNPTINYSSPNVAGTLTFTPVPNASGVATITVTVKDDGGTTNGGQDTITRSFQVTVTKPPELYVNSISVNEPATGTVEAVFEIELRGASSLPVTVLYAAADGTATAGSDYQASIGQLEFPGAPRIEFTRSGDQLSMRWTDALKAFDLVETDVLGSSAWRKSLLPVTVQGSDQSVAVPVSVGTRFFKLSSETRRQLVRILVLSDQDSELDEKFFLRLSDPVNAVIVQRSGEAIIHDGTLPPPPPPPAPVVRIAAPENDDVFPTGSDIFVKAEVTPSTASVTKMEFFANGQPIGSATQIPFAMTWTNVPKGDYALTARATDNSGAQFVSQSVSITVEDVCVGSKRVAIVQNFAAPEISKLQAWLADLDLCSHVFNREGLTFDALQTYDLVIWDDLGALPGGLFGNDVSVFHQVHNAGIPLYFIGNDLARATGSLPANAQSVWTGLLHLKPADTEANSQLVTISEQGHPVTNGPFGVAGGFKLASDYDLTTATGTGETVLAHAGNANVLLAHEEAATSVRTVTQNVLAFEGPGLTSGVQREKLFKNAVWWLLKRLPPPPFLNLRVALTTPTEQPGVGQPYTFTAEVQHGGELEATGITLTVTLPDGWEFVSATSAAGSCSFEDGVVVCLLGRLSRAEAASVSIAVRSSAAGSATLEANVSANQPEAVSEDNSVRRTVVVEP